MVPPNSVATMSAIERDEPMWPTFARFDCSITARRIRPASIELSSLNALPPSIGGAFFHACSLSRAVEHAPGHPEIERIVAPNPGPMTLEGTNTYLVGEGPCAVVDPGPDDEGHLEAVRAAAAARGGVGLVLLTHSHGDHADGAGRLGVEPVYPRDGEVNAGLETVGTPGHAPDHVCLLLGRVCF